MKLFSQRMSKKTENSQNTKKITIEDVYILLKSYKDDISEIKSSITKINK